MKKKTFSLLASLLAICAILTTAAFAVTEHSWFRSDTGTGLNLVLDWKVTHNEGAEQIQVSAALEHYALHVGARSVTLTIGNQVKAVSTPAIHTDDNTMLQTTPLFTDTLTVPRAPGETVEVPIRASWVFGGVYAGKNIDLLKVEKTLILSDSGVKLREGITGGDIVTTPAAEPDLPVQPTLPADPDMADPIGGPAYSQQWRFRSDNGTWLNLICEVQAADSLGSAGMYDVTYSLTLEYYSLWMSAKTGSITVGGETRPFTAPAITQPDNTLHRVTLTTHTFTAAPGQTFDISAEMPFFGTYSGKALEKVAVSGSFTLD